MPSAKEEFKRLCYEVRSSGVASVTFFNKNHFEHNKSLSGYVEDYDKKTPHIALVKPRRVTYRMLILLLLHEIGHIIDFRRYGRTKRAKICEKYISYTQEGVKKSPSYPSYAKKARLLDEYLAEINGRKLLKKFNVSIDPPYTKKELDAYTFLELKIVKYEMLHGKFVSSRLKKIWRKELLINQPNMSLREYVDDLYTL